MSDTRPPSAFEQAFHPEVDQVLTPASVEELAEAVDAASAAGRCVVPCGSGSQAHLGVPVAGGITLVSCERLRAVRSYEPADFTIGVESGLDVRELRALLAENGQEVPVDVARQGSGTVGGWLAAGLTGPRQARCGSLRNWLIGLHGLRSGSPPERFKSGGMVVKNVAGYDAAKFLVGSLGTAGVILEANFKLRAIPPRRSLRVAGFSQRRQAERLARAVRTRHLAAAAVLVLDRGAAALLSRVVPSVEPSGHWVLWVTEGQPSAVAWQEAQIDALLAERDPEAVHALDDDQQPLALDFLCNLGHPAGSPAPGVPTEPASTPPNDLGIVSARLLPTEAADVWRELADAAEGEGGTVASTACALSGTVLLRWRLPPERVDAPLRALTTILERHRRAGLVLYLPPAVRARHAWRLVPDPAAALARRIRCAFDPAGCFSADRVLGPSEVAP